MAGLSEKIAHAKAAGYNDAEIAGFLRSDEALKPKFEQAKSAGYSDAEVLAFLSKPPPDSAPAARVKQKRNVYGEVAGAMANFNRGLGVGDELAAGAKTVGGLLSGDVAPGGLLSAFKDNMAAQRTLEDDYIADRPVVGGLLKGTGMAATVGVPGGGSAGLLASSPRWLNIGRGATTAGLMGAGVAATDRGTLEERAQAVGDVTRSPLTYALGGAAGAIGPAARAPKAGIAADVIALREKGITLTPGQMRGGLAKAAEDGATSLPILGTAIQDARRAGIETFDIAVANEALAPVGLKMPKGIPAGHKAVEYVERKLGGLYDKVIPQGAVRVDDDLRVALTERMDDIAQDMTPASRSRLLSILNNRVTSRFGPDGIDGKTFQRIHSELGTSKARFDASQDADQRAIGEALGVVQEELRKAAGRQYPAFEAAKGAIDKGYALFKRMQGAGAALGAEGGVFTPAQYGGAVRRGDRSLDKGASARGDALGQDLADSARAVLPNNVPDSGTATRGMIAGVASAPGALIAAGMAAGPAGVAATAAGYGGALAGLKLGSKAYTAEAIEAANFALDKRISRQQAAEALDELRRMAEANPEVASLYVQVRDALARAGGAGSARQPAVEVSIEGRPDLGTGRAYGTGASRQ